MEHTKNPDKNATPPALGAEGIPGAQCRPAGQPPGTAGWPQGRKGGISKHANVGQDERVKTPPSKKKLCGGDVVNGSETVRTQGHCVAVY